MSTVLYRFFKPSNRSLLRELVTSDFKLRYQGSVLGYLWSLMRPLLLFGVLYIVFTKFVKFGEGVPHFPAYLLLGIVLWTFFVEATQSGMNSITGRGDMVRKVKIPKYIIVFSTTFSAFINFCLNLVVVAVFMVLGDVPFRWTLALAPIFIAELVLLTLALSYLLSALFVKFRDISHIWEVILQAFFYITPIIYPLSIVPEKFAKLISLSPLTQIFQDVRSVVITPETLTTKQVFDSQLIGRGLPILIIFGLSLLAVWYFRRNSPKFAEEL